MRILNRKLRRDLWHMKGQAFAIAMIIASGTGLWVMSMSIHSALDETVAAYYERYRFADAFAELRRAPTSVATQIAGIDGVQTAQARIVANAILDIDGVNEPVQARLVSLAEHGELTLNKLALRSGRLPRPGHADEVVLSEQFAIAHDLIPGKHFAALMNGRKQRLTVVGTTLSPEYIYAMAPGALMPDDRRFGIIWMPYDTLAAAFDLDGAFNSISVALLRSADVRDVIAQMDNALGRYGGVGAVARKDQLSNWFVMNELDELKQMATILPGIFLIVAAFLTNMVLARLIAVERSEIGLLKANGYTNRSVSWHYLKLVAAIAAIGIVLGWVIGIGLGRYGATLYAKVFHFPLFIFEPQPSLFLVSAAIGLAAAWLGTIGAVARVARLPPAEAMRPQQPTFRRHARTRPAESKHWLDQPSRIVLRQLARNPLRAAIATLGMAAGVAVMVLALQWADSITALLDTEYYRAQRQDYSIALTEPRNMAAAFDIAHLPGVLAAEPTRYVSADLQLGNRIHRGSLQGLVKDAELQPLFDVNQGVQTVPDSGLVLSTWLAKKLQADVGDVVTVSVLSGRRPVRDLTVMQIVETNLGMPAWMELNALNRLLGDGPALQSLLLKVDEAQEAKLLSVLRDVPAISAVSSRRAAVSMFHETIEKTILIYIGFYIVFAVLLSFGVCYNNARITLSENGRDLATLRVLGLTRAEIGYICLAETALLALLAIPLGYLLGYGLAVMMSSTFSNELFRAPLVVTSAALGNATLVALGAAVVSLLIVRVRLDRLDLIAVLKTRE